MYFAYFAMFCVAVAYGILVALTDWLRLIFFAPILPIIGIFLDYRIGVVLLMILMPLSMFLPQFHGFNIITYLSFTTSFSLCAKAYTKKYDINLLPPWVWWAYLLPVTWAAFIGLGHLREVPVYMLLLSNATEMTAYNYLNNYIFKPFLKVLLAWLLACAVVHSKRPERFLPVFVISATLPSLAIVIFVLKSGASMSAIARRGFLSEMGGMHANEFGMMLVMVFGPLLFLIPALRSLWAKFATLIALSCVLGGVMITFSRGAYVAVLIILVAFFLTRENKALSLAMAAGALLLGALAIPGEVIERATLGLESSRHSSNKEDKLTAGRVEGWYILFPEVLKNPVIGNGLESTFWSNGVKYGWYFADHPHSVYLRILMDTGIVGFVLVLYFYWRLFQFLYHAPGAPPLFRAFFHGMAASLSGFLVDGFTNGSFAPRPEHTYLWMIFGISLGLARLAKAENMAHDGKSQLELPRRGTALDITGNNEGALNRSLAS